jgi:hypothetical protein
MFARFIANERSYNMLKKNINRFNFLIIMVIKKQFVSIFFVRKLDNLRLKMSFSKIQNVSVFHSKQVIMFARVMAKQNNMFNMKKQIYFGQNLNFVI